MSNDNQNRDSFGSKIGAIAAAAGSAIGLGNIYRFPCVAGENGGGAFLIVYLFIILFLGVPIMISEFVIGRRSKRNTVGAFKLLAPKTGWSKVGYIGILCAFLILAYYSTIAGWTLEYIYKSIINNFAGKDLHSIEQEFNNFNNSAIRPLIWQAIFLFLTAFVIIKGIKNGIEKYTKILMPLLLVILIILCIKSLTLNNASEGLNFFFKPDFSKITGKVFISALGQAFFSLSIGMGALITYGSYISKKDNLITTVTYVCLIDTFVAVMAGIIIFPAAMSFGISPKAGDGLVFNILPMIFNKMTGGYIFCLIFFILLAIAALTSTISLLEVIVAFLNEELNISRNKATIYGSVATLIIGLLATSSRRNGSILSFGNITFFNILDYFTNNILLPTGGLLIVLFLGWKFGKKQFNDEITNEGTIRIALKNFIFFIIKFIAPFAILVIFINVIFPNFFATLFRTIKI